MFTHSDAVSSKCHPVRRWNGSSSVSLPHQATTRCWKVYRPSRSVQTHVCALLAGALLLVPAALTSQQSVLKGPSHPEVVSLTLKGVKAMKTADLLPSIYTTQSYCNSFILKPFCWISKSRNFYTKKYLDHKELERDVLRIRVFYWKRGYRETEVDTAGVARGSNKVGVTFFIKEGPPILITNVAVNQANPLLSRREIDRSLAI